METVSISELKSRLSEFLAAVRGGQEILVTDRGKPVARISKVNGLASQDERRARLAREGVLRLRRFKLENLTPPSGEGPTGVLSTLLEEREEGR